MRYWLVIGLSLLSCTAYAKPKVTIVASAFVLEHKFEQLQAIATAQDVQLEVIRPEGHLQKTQVLEQLNSSDLIILDTPRPNDLEQVSAYLAEITWQREQPWIQVGAGRPQYDGIPKKLAQFWIDYYAYGGAHNMQLLLTSLINHHEKQPLLALPEAQKIPVQGIYHPQAGHFFTELEDYIAWAEQRHKAPTARVAFAINKQQISDMQTSALDELIQRSEAQGLLPIIFWFDSEQATALTDFFAKNKPNVIINMQHMQNGNARLQEFSAFNIPVLQTLTYRDGNQQQWLQADQGVPARTVAPFLSVTESWGMSDPMVISAVEDGRVTLMAAQIESVLHKVKQLIKLQQQPNSDKKVALLFWNNPVGEKNIAASHLNIPRSLVTITQALSQAGYAITTQSETNFIEIAQQLLSGVYHPETLQDLYKQGLAKTLPLADYQQYLTTLPDEEQHALVDRWGPAEKHWALHSIEGQLQFVFPAIDLGHLILLPQPSRAGDPEAFYHDAKVPPDHLYLAAYRYLNQQSINAIIHLGTHGTQEWLPGKDRGLSVTDYPFLTVGDIPVFYPYIQDNIGEAIQAKRRGRAVTISHQTPPFAPGGLYDELRDLHQLLEEYQQLEPGAAQQQTQNKIIALVTELNLHKDMQWQTSQLAAEFPEFLAALHDHLQQLAQEAIPLGLHTFGEPASVTNRLTTVMQQLGAPYYAALGVDAQQVFAVEAEQITESRPYQVLAEYVLNKNAPKDASNLLLTLLQQGESYFENLSEPQELHALINGLAGGFVAPGTGGDPVRNPLVASGRNLYAFEANKIPTQAAYQAGDAALLELLKQHQQQHAGNTPKKIAFSLWSSETLRHLGVVESQVLHALGLQPRWDQGGRLIALDIIPRQQLGRPRIDTVVQVTSVYRDQFDHFMHLLAGAIEQLSQLDEDDNPIAQHSQRIEQQLLDSAVEKTQAKQLAQIRLFSNQPGDYGTGVSKQALASTEWEDDSVLAEQFLSRMQYAYGTQHWGAALTKTQGNLFTQQLKGTELAIMSRSSELNGVLSTDHPFEFLGGLSRAIELIDGQAPDLYIADLRKTQPKITKAERFLADELRSHFLNRQWITAMQAEGYAGTLEILNTINNVWGWQAMNQNMVRADQWQELHETFVMDKRDLQLNPWFEQHNASAQVQIIERLIEAIRKGYWSADERTQQQLVERWQDLTERTEESSGAQVTRDFIDELALGFGMTAPTNTPGSSQAGETVTGQFLEATPAPSNPTTSSLWSYIWLLLLAVCAAGAMYQHYHNQQRQGAKS
ncbi:MAG: cobaltochelatase subunit CobN [Pseudomonas sp.]|nr:cobaltochelatase subunit CobN [Pseudomonas sp.]